MFYRLNLHEMSLHVRKSVPSPEQLSLSAEAAGFWQCRALVCVPVPQVNVHGDHADHGVHPTLPDYKYATMTYVHVYDFR